MPRRDESDDEFDRDRDEFEPRPRRQPPAASNVAATVAVVLGVLSLCLGCLAGVPALGFGYVGLGRASAAGGRGRGAAIVGLVLGGLSTLGTVALIPIGIVLFPTIQDGVAAKPNGDKLKQIGLAAHNHDSSLGHFPVNEAVTSKPQPPAANPVEEMNRRAERPKPPTPAFSWRVGLLPFVEQNDLYRRFDRTQPWDGPANKPVTDTRVPVYAAHQDPATETRTHWQGFSARGALFEFGRKRGVTGITDGTSNTIFVAERPTLKPWGEPNDDDQYVPGAFGSPAPPVPPLGGRDGAKIALVVMCDGAVKVVNVEKMSPDVFRALVTPDGGEAVSTTGMLK
jgi:Protein of unknown function (DUF1559)